MIDLLRTQRYIIIFVPKFYLLFHVAEYWGSTKTPRYKGRVKNRLWNFPNFFLFEFVDTSLWQGIETKQKEAIAIFPTFFLEPPSLEN